MLDEFTMNAMKRLYLILFFLPVFLSVYAVPASPEPFFVEQADGTSLLVRMCGDEYGGYISTIDGWAVAKDEDSNYKYIVFETNATPRLTNVVAHNAEMRDADELLFLQQLNQRLPVFETQRQRRKVAAATRISSSFPRNGSPRSIAILVNFADESFVVSNPKEAFTRLLNESGYAENGGVGSARDYFIASSDSAFQPIFDVYGPYTLSNDMAYYGANVGDNNSPRAADMVMEACFLAEAAGVNFKDYDTDNDGTIDNVFIYYAGHNEAEGADKNTIWPHRSIVTNTSAVVSGVRIYDYACTSELRGRSGTSMCGIGTFCHEFGHVLGLADLYDTQKSSRYTVGEWDIMCSGSYNGNGKTPPSYTAFERFSLGWLTPVQLEAAGRYQLQPLPSSNQAYLIAADKFNMNPTSNSEYFLLENRQNIGWDAPSSALPGTGLLIWHIDYNAAAWNNNAPNNGTPLRCYVEPAHGRTQTSSLPTEPFPGTLGITQFNPVLHNGTSLSMPLLSIEQIGEDIAFVFKGDGDIKFACFPAELEPFASTYDPFTNQATYEVQTLLVTGNSLDPLEQVTFTTRSNFQLSTDSVRWATSYSTFPEIDSTLSEKIFLRYKPDKMVCKSAAGTLGITSSTTQVLKTLQGISPRPVYIDVPQTNDPVNISPYSFTLTWVPQADAEDYYLTLYTKEDGKSVYLQSFESFLSEIDIQMQEWYATFLRTTSSVSSDGLRSIWFRETGDSIASETYVQPVTELSFWLNAMTTDAEEVGTLRLWTFDGTSWTQIEEVAIRNNMKRTVKSYSFDEKDNYIRFALSFTATGGAGVAFDAFRAVCSGKINYIFSGRDKVVPAVMNTQGQPSVENAYCYFDNLTPDTEYFYQIRCGESKGCSENLSALSEVKSIRTLSGQPADNRYLTLGIDSLHYDRVAHVVYVPVADSNRTLYIYDVYGHLITTINVPAMQNCVVLPTEKFISGNVYIVKYSLTDKLKRKDKWVKIMF